MSRQPGHLVLSKRERQIMDVLYRLGRATAAEIQQQLPGDPHSSTVRTQLRILEGKGHVRHDAEGLRYVYVPTVSHKAARASAVRHVADTFFEGSTANVVMALLDRDATRLSEDELDRIAELIDAARRQRR